MTSRRLFVFAACIAFVAGTAAWILVGVYLDENVPSRDLGQLSDRSLGEPRPRRTPDYLTPGDLPAPPPLQDAAHSGLQIPVTWLSPPDEFPESGVPLELLNTEGHAVPGISSLLFHDAISLRGALADGMYRWRNADEVVFPYVVWLRVENGVASVVRDPIRKVSIVPLHYLVPIHLEVTGSALEQFTLQFASGSDDRVPLSAWVSRFTWPGNTTRVMVPHSIVSVSIQPKPGEASEDQDAGPVRLISSTLQGRKPKRDELVRLHVDQAPMMLVELRQRADETRQTLRLLRGDAEGDIPWRFRIELLGAGNEFPEFDVSAKETLRETDLSSMPGLVAQFTTQGPTVASRTSVGVLVYTWQEGTGAEPALLAIGLCDLEPSTAVQRVYAVVAPRDWVIECEVVDTNGKPRPNLGFRVQPQLRSAGESMALPGGITSYTDRDGRARFDGLPRAGLIVASLDTVGWQMPRETRRSIPSVLGPADPGTPTIVRIVISAETEHSLVLRLDPSRLPEEQQATFGRQTVGYAVLPAASGDRADVDMVSHASIDDQLRIVTSVRQSGRYLVVIQAYFGELVANVEHDAATGREAVIEVNPYRMVSIRVHDGDDQPLQDVLVFSRPLPLHVAWALAQAQTNGMGIQGARRIGSRGVRMNFGSDVLDPMSWLLFHHSHGLFYARQIAGTVDDGFIASGVRPVDSGSIRVGVEENFEWREGFEYVASVTSVYTTLEPGRSRAYVGVGKTVTLDLRGVLVGALPAGRYLVAVRAQKDGRQFDLQGPGWVTEIDVTNGSTVDLSFPRR